MRERATLAVVAVVGVAGWVSGPVVVGLGAVCALNSAKPQLVRVPLAAVG